MKEVQVAGNEHTDHVKSKSSSKRYVGLDAFRGCILISMILYHGVWDVVYLFGVELSWFQSSLVHIGQQSICWSFILLSGFCWSFGRTKWKRGLIVFLAGAVVTIITKLFMPESIILFGVLTMLGSSMLLMIVLDKLLGRCHPVIGLFLSFTAFVVTRNVNVGHLGFEQWKWMALPENWYANGFTTYLGFTQPGFISTDYFSVVPWIFLFMTGYFLFHLFKEKQWIVCFDIDLYRGLGWLSWMGRHSLLIYMLHQPVVYGALVITWKVLQREQ